MAHSEIIWYGPHACAVCRVMIIKAATEQGGAEVEPPARLMRIWQRGAEAGDVEIVYPQTWTPHVHRAKNDHPPAATEEG